MCPDSCARQSDPLMKLLLLLVTLLITPRSPETVPQLMHSSSWKTKYFGVKGTAKWKTAWAEHFQCIPIFPLWCYSRGGANASDGGVKTERAQDQKEKMLAELRLLWKEQCDHLRRKKEQFATEVRSPGINTRKYTRFTLLCWIISLSSSILISY